MKSTGIILAAGGLSLALGGASVYTIDAAEVAAVPGGALAREAVRARVRALAAVQARVLRLAVGPIGARAAVA